MKHLSREELVDSLDGPLPPARQAHVDSCTHCHTERDALAGVMREMLRADVPEPSPLFWDHLSARVRESLANEPLPTPTPAIPTWLSWLTGHWAWSSVTVALCIIVAGIGWQELRTMRTSPLLTSDTAVAGRASSVAKAGEETRNPVERKSAPAVRAPRVSRAPLANANAEHAADMAVALRPATVTDDDWNLMMRVAEDIPWDDDGAAADATSNGLTIVRPETADAVVRELTADERRELVRLLREEMTRRPPSS